MCIEPDRIRVVNWSEMPRNTGTKKNKISGDCSTRLHCLMQSYGMILAGLAMACLYWVFEAAMHGTILDEGSLLTGMSPNDPDEFWTRLFVACCFLAFGVSAQWMMARCRQARVKLLLQTRALGERVKELNCLYSISRLMEVSPASLEEILQGAVDLIPPSWQYPEVACARITIGDEQYTTRGFRETEWRQVSSVNVEDGPVGSVEVCYLEKRPDSAEGPFLQEERALIDGISELVSQMIERTRGRETLQHAHQKIERLHEIARHLGGLECEDDVYSTTVEAAETILSFSMCTLDIVDGDMLVPKATSSEVPVGASHEGELDSGGLAAETFRTGETTVFGSLAEVPQAIPSSAALRSGISARIGIDIGVFQVASEEQNAFEDEDVRMLELLLGHASEAINRIRLTEQLQEQALRDPLTGVYNRRHFNQVIELEIGRSKRYSHPIGFLMIDIDGFKEINDRHGHQVGDEVLQRIAALLVSQVRDADIVVRYGGDEFLLVLPETNGATEVIRRRILEEAARRNNTNTEFDFPVTLSIGSANWSPESDRAVEEILAEADARMYEEKRSQAREG